MRRLFNALCASLAVMAGFSAAANSMHAADKLELKPGSKICIIGNATAERMQLFNVFETRLHQRFPEHELVVRNLGWSGDSVSVRMRSQNFQDHGHRLVDHNPDVILAFFGFNESFAGPKGLPQFKKDLAKLLGQLKQQRYDYQNYKRGSTKPSIQATATGDKTPQIVLVSPMANEDLPARNIMAGTKNNPNLKLYTAAMAEVAKAEGVMSVDVFAHSEAALKGLPDAVAKLTINGCHQNALGSRLLANALEQGLFNQQADTKFDLINEDLQAAVAEKNLQFFYDYRAINGFYIYGGREKPFGVVNFPAEFAKLRKMIAKRDEVVWSVAQGEELPKSIDDSGTGDFTDIKTNYKNPIRITPPEEAIDSFKLPEGYVIELFASEVDFPDLKNPVQMAFDAKGRMWVTTMESYPMYLPGTPVSDKILILDDTNGDGKADKQTIFADGLHVPTGIELGHGGAYVAQQPNIVFLKDTDGDDKADVKQVRLHGFDSADSHHAISAFTWDPGGALYCQEGTFHHSQVESPYGPTYLANAGIFRYEPRSEKFGVFVSYGFANPWGHTFDQWGQNFVADASGGANYYGTAFSGDTDHPYKRRSLKQFLKKQWRPTSGCELVSSSNFPKEAQGNYLLNNVIGFHGVLQYRVSDDGSGFKAEPVEPLLRSADSNFRPVDLQFGPDGALYIVDWFNPLIGHMQHSIRDPNRDTNHGRIWRIRYAPNELVKSPNIADASTTELVKLLDSYEDRTRYRVRRELGARKTDEVLAAVDGWLAGIGEDDKNAVHKSLEALWVYQWHDKVNEPLLKKLLRSSDYRARAGATRVLCYWRDRVKEPLALLQTQVNDEHPRVRLEAVRALSFFKGADAAKALEIVVESLIYDQDAYLEYTLKETMDTLERRTK